MKKYVIISIALFTLSFLIGFIILYNFDLGLEEIEYTPVESPDFFELIYTNGSVCLFLIFGVGIVTIPLGFYQGLQLGAMFALWVTSGSNIFYFVLLTLPHCLFELPALIISIGIGLKFCSLLIKYYRHEQINVKCSIKKIKWWLISIPILLLIAGFVESYFTGWLFNTILF